MTRRLISYFAAVAAAAALGTGVAVAQPDETDIFRPQDTKALRALVCSRDGVPFEAFIHVTPSFSDAQRLNTHMDRDMIQAEVEKTWRAIASSLTAEQLYSESYAEAAGEIFGKNAAILQQEAESKSGGVSLRVEEITTAPMDPEHPNAPRCASPS